MVFVAHLIECLVLLCAVAFSVRSKLLQDVLFRFVSFRICFYYDYFSFRLKFKSSKPKKQQHTPRNQFICSSTSSHCSDVVCQNLFSSFVCVARDAKHEENEEKRCVFVRVACSMATCIHFH